MDHKSTLIEANAAITAGDYEKFLTYCTEDTEWTFVGDKVITGISEVRKYIAEAYKQPPKFEVHIMIQEGDYLTAIGKISMLDENYQWTEYEYCDVWKFENGKMATLKAFVI